MLTGNRNAGVWVLVAAVCGCLLVAADANGQTAQTAADGVLLYETRVQPIFVEHCVRCHGADPHRLASDLSLMKRSGLLRGGAHGPAINTSDPGESLLLRAISYHDEVLMMPPSGKLADEDIDAITQWVNLGAPFGGDEDHLVSITIEEAPFEITEEDRQWWSVRPLVEPDVPQVRDRAWPRNDVDRFILARLDDADLTPAADAGKAALIRRATYDLTGLPPSPEEVAAFIADARPDAYERLIDRLLASPQYGVKWGRHWLDLVRFAETDSYERDRLKPGAWRYRDWVIDAFNADMPYDEFLIHQLAGDEIEQVTADSIIATGYMRLGIWDDEPTDTALAQYDDLDSILDTTSRVMLGMSMGCARCHDHKGDPIPQADYYRMLSYFRGIAPYKVGGGNAPTPQNYVVSIPADLGLPNADVANRQYAEQRERLHEQLAAIVEQLRREAPESLQIALALEQADSVAVHLPLDEVPAGAEGIAVEGDPHPVNGIADGAMQFDGDHDALRIDRPVADDFTISVWFRTSMPARGGNDLRWFRGNGLVDGEVPGIVRDFGLSMVGDGHVTAGVGQPETFVASGPGYHDGEWHHAALTRSRESGEVRLYVDGELVDSKRGSTEPLDAPRQLTIGRMQPGGGFFDGVIDDVLILDRAMSDEDVFTLAMRGLTSDRVTAVTRAVSDNLAQQHEAVTKALRALKRPRREMINVLCVKEVGPAAPPTHVLIRGNPHAPAALVEPGVPMILESPDATIGSPIAHERTTGRRMAIAQWIADEGNLRTARVMANRIWQYHFGRGLSRTPNDFGVFGEQPTHPELLDWLAVQFMESGWSIKQMHRLIMNSRAYQLSSRPSADALRADPENDLFARFDMRRLTAEEIRDSILAMSGTLNLEMGGPGVYPPMPDEVLATSSRPNEAWGRSTPEQAARRSVYIHVKRSLLTPLLVSMDLADTDATCPVRFVTTQPTQALTMLNSAFTNEQAELFARRVKADVADSMDKQVRRAIELVTARAVTDEEVAAGMRFVDDIMREEQMSTEQAFACYCLVLLNLNEFVYLD